MLFAFHCLTSISFVFLYLFIFVRYFLTPFCIYIFLPPLFTPHFLKIADWQSKAQVFFKPLTRERLFNSSIMSPGYSSIFNENCLFFFDSFCHQRIDMNNILQKRLKIDE